MKNYNCINNRNHETDEWEPLNCTVETRDDEDLPLFFAHGATSRSPSRKTFRRPKGSALKKSISTKRLKELFGLFHFPVYRPNHMGYQEHRMLIHEDGSNTSESYIYDLSIQKSASIDSWMSFSEDGYSSCNETPAQFHHALDITDISDLTASSPSLSSSEDFNFDDLRSMYSI